MVCMDLLRVEFLSCSFPQRTCDLRILMEGTMHSLCPPSWLTVGDEDGDCRDKKLHRSNYVPEQAHDM